MSSTFFNHSQNLQIHGDVNIISSGGSAQGQDGRGLLKVRQQDQASISHSQIIERGFKILCDNTAPSARYESGHSFTRPQCHPGTRRALQDHIFKWFDDEDGPVAMWMHGPVGIGKSAIAQTVACRAAEHERLSSAFFFFRSDVNRNTAKHLVPTLAYEMTQQIPSTLKPVCEAIAANPLVFSSHLENQISSVLLRPLSVCLKSRPLERRLIIIDGLDECLEINNQCTIIRSFILSLLSGSAQDISHKILIVSRPESHISSAFAALDIRYHFRHLALESWHTEDDIGTFLRAKLDKILHTHPLRHHLPEVWPDEESFTWLRQQSTGSFAYASVVIRHLASHNYNPDHALQDLLSLRPSRAATAFADLDTLYRHILLSIDLEIRFTLKRVLCLYVYLAWDTIDDLASLLSMDKSIVEIALIRASSVIQIHDGRRKMKFYHSSFEEFLRDNARSGDLYVFYPNVASSVATALSRLWLSPTDLYYMFRRISAGLSCLSGFCRDSRLQDMNFHVLNTLVSTKLPLSFCYHAPTHLVLDPGKDVAELCVALQRNSQDNSDPELRSLYSRAFTVVCDWLQSLFYRLFNGSPTVKDVIDILLEDKGMSPQLYPFIGVFKVLTEAAHGASFYCLYRVFPRIDRLEINREVFNRYLTMLIRQRHENMRTHKQYSTYNLKRLYIMICNGIKMPEFSHILEKLVLEGITALGPVPGIYVTPLQCIFCFLCGHSCYIDNSDQLAIGNQKVSDIMYSWPLDRNYLSLAAKTDQYIRQAHLEHDFTYLSKEVEALYRATSPAPLRPTTI